MKNLVNLKTITLWISLLALSVPAIAQPPGRGQGGRRMMTEEDIRDRVSRIADSLEMTAEQEEKIIEIELAYLKKNQERFENFDPQTGDREEMRAYMMQQREERLRKYAGVLTEEQMAKFQEMMERRRQNMRRQRDDDSGGRGRGRGRG
jgi:Spy/CpxP family protein refolding chaperone